MEKEQRMKNFHQNMNLMCDGYLNLASALCFSNKAAYNIKIIASSSVKEVNGKVRDMFDEALSFALSNLPCAHTIEDGVIEELLVNAIIHHDYLADSPVIISIFSDRLELINPGSLLRSLTIENIKAGVSIKRNPILSSYASHILPYRGARKWN